MSKVKELEEILKSDVLFEVNGEIEELRKLILRQNNSGLEDELSYMEDVKKYYDEVLTFIEKDLLVEEVAIGILEDLEDMREDGDEL
jgi:hypothetical protein